MASLLASDEFIYSNLAGDPDLAELVDVFLDEVPSRVSRLIDCANGRDWEGLRRLAHQIKGSAGSYGFSEVPPHAAQLERNLKDGQAEEVILSNVNELVDMCNRLRGGLPA